MVSGIFFNSLENIPDFTIKGADSSSWGFHLRIYRDEHAAKSIAAFYNLYSHGYYFLRNLGLVYGLMIEVPAKDFKGDCWDDLNPEEKETLIASFYPSIIEEIDKVNKWLENRSIVLTGKQNNIGMWEYIDRRQEDEKKATSYQVAEEMNLSHKRRWWKFWK